MIDETAMTGAPSRVVPSASSSISSRTSRDARGVGEVGLGDDEDAAARAEQMEDVEMLLGLRHHAVVGGDGEEHEVDAVGAGEHVADEALVAGDVDDAGAGAVGEGEVGEAEIDRDAALLFFLEAVGVLAGQGFDERGFAVIDVAGGADDGVGGGGHRGKNLTPGPFPSMGRGTI